MANLAQNAIIRNSIIRKQVIFFVRSRNARSGQTGQFLITESIMQVCSQVWKFELRRSYRIYFPLIYPNLAEVSKERKNNKYLKINGNYWKSKVKSKVLFQFVIKVSVQSAKTQPYKISVFRTNFVTLLLYNHFFIWVS